jgi:hypothetical protein
VLLVPPGTVSERSRAWPQLGQSPGSLFPHDASGLDANAARRKNPAIPSPVMPRVMKTGSEKLAAIMSR